MSVAQSRSAPQLSLGLALLVAFSLSLFLAGIMLIFTAFGAIALAWSQIKTLSTVAHTTPVSLMTEAVSGWWQRPTETNGRKNILILGVDSLESRGDAPPLTDTMLITSLDLKSGQLHLLSLPRDLWSDRYQVRINGLYWLDLEQNPTQALTLVKSELETLTALPLHHIVVVSLENVGELIDLIGGVNVDVKEGFIDTRFPRTDVDVTIEKDPQKLYETIEFKPGLQTMSGQTALKFIRSRKSLGDEGSDDARIVRQQLVIQALFQKVSQKQNFRNPELLGKLYYFYTQHLAKYLPVTEAIATAKVILPMVKDIKFSGQNLSLYPENTQGVIYHPPEASTNGAWIYKVRNLKALQQEVQQKLQFESEVLSN